LAFPHHDDRISSGSSIVSERLTTHLASIKGIRVVERRLISKLMEEQKLNETGVIDSSTAQKIGQVLGINVIVTGTLIDLSEEETEVNARCLKTDTGEIITASSVKVERTWKDRPKTKRAPKKYNMDSTSKVRVKPKEAEAIEVGYPTGGRYHRVRRRYR